MKRRVVVFLALCLLAVSSCAWADYWDEGHEGTADDPYVIDTIADLVALRDRVNNGTESGDMYYKLTQNLNISQYTDWQPIGYRDYCMFTGHFDGNGKQIRINVDGRGNESGLFWWVNTEADTYAVKNLTVSGTLGGDWAVGIAANLNSGIIDNCSFTGTLSMNTVYRMGGGFSGIVGTMRGGKITNCTVNATINGNDSYKYNSGGIVAYVTGGSVENCKVEGTKISDIDCAGGIVGYAELADFDYIKDCTFSGTIDANRDGAYVGGIVGYIKGGNLLNNSVITDSHGNLPSLTADYVGGIAGRTCDVTIVENCDVSSGVTVSGGAQAIGGIVGLMDNFSTVKDNRSYASIEGDISDMGGVVGRLNASTYTISNNEYSSAENGIGNNGSGHPSEEGCVQVETAITITTDSTLPEAVVGVAYSKTLSSDADVAVVWAVANSTPLPAGLSLERLTGKISGKPTTEGDYTFTVKAIPTDGAFAAKEMSLKVYPEGTVPITITKTSLPAGVVGVAYDQTLTSNPSDVVWSLDSGELPDGLSFTADTGKITGKPTKAGTYTFTVTASRNAFSISQTYTVEVTKVALSCTIPSTIVRGVTYTWQPQASGGTSPYTWSISSGSLPTGMALNVSTGNITGTPTTAGTFKFTLKTADKDGASATKTYTVKVTQTTLSGSVPSTSVIKAAVTWTIKATKGTAPYKWSISSGSLPTGLTIDPNTGIISGTLTATGTFKFTVKITDKNNIEATKAYTVKITKPAISGTLPGGVYKAAYTGVLTASNGTADYTWTISKGALPDGLSLGKTTGKITGTPTKTGTFEFTVKITDKNKATATKAYTVKVTKPAISGTLANGAYKAEYSGTLTASGGTAAYTWTISKGALPDGLSLGKSTGKITGTPTKTGTFEFTVKITDKNKATATKAFTVKVTKTKMTGQLSVAAIQNYYYSSTLTVSNGTPAYTWTVSKNTLPEGLKLTYSGTSATVAGTPTKAGTYTFTLKVADKNKVAVSKSFTIYVLPASVISAASSTAKTESTGTSDSEATNGTSDTAKSHGSGTVSQPGYESGTGLQGDGNTIVRVSLNVASEDVVESYEGKDSDLVKVKANKALNFVLGDWGTDVLDVAVYVDDRAVDGVAVKGNSFTLPAEKVHDDFKVAVKAKTKDGELESEELFVISE